MQKRYVPTMVVLGILVLIAVIGYAYPQERPAEPTRILFDNAGGKVIFDHKQHAEAYGIECKTCHHESVASTDPMECGACHGVAITDTYRASHKTQGSDESCITCHHVEFVKKDWGHEEHKDYADDCTACHHTPDIEDEPQACSNCHMDESDESMPSFREAAHIRCMNCHEDTFFADQLKGCQNCHTLVPQRQELENGTLNKESFSKCSSCHYMNDGELIFNRMGAFHTQCMGCHELEKKGPYTKEQCNQCHYR